MPGNASLLIVVFKKAKLNRWFRALGASRTVYIPVEAVCHHLCNQYKEATIEAGLAAIHEAEFVDYSCLLLLSYLFSLA
jgi:hypothetical protein